MATFWADKDILFGRKCPYCGTESKYIDSEVVFGKSYAMIYACLDCKAWVGVHIGTDEALGRLANQELRNWKRATHELFDPLWKQLLNHGVKIPEARKACYLWLSEQLSIPFEYTHIGMFDVAQCKQACESIKELLAGGGLQVILQHDETINFIHPINQNNPIHIDQLSLSGRDPYIREVYDVLEQYAKQHDLQLLALQSIQFRMSGHDKMLDIFPVTRKYYDVTGKAHGYYGYLKNFLNNYFEKETDPGF